MVIILRSLGGAGTEPGLQAVWKNYMRNEKPLFYELPKDVKADMQGTLAIASDEARSTPCSGAMIEHAMCEALHALTGNPTISKDEVARKLSESYFEAGLGGVTTCTHLAKRDINILAGHADKTLRSARGGTAISC